MKNKQVVSINWVRMVVTALEAYGYDAKRHCENSGINYDQLWCKEFQYREVALVSLWRAATLVSKNRAIGLSTGHISLACFDWLSSHE